MDIENAVSQQLIFSPEILRLLTTLLYPDPRMAIREILANAADAISMALPVYPSGLQPQIVVTPNRVQSTLIIDDNGVGLKFDETTVLNTIGADEDKRRRFEDLLNRRNNSNELADAHLKDKLIELIGRYGIGRLACLCIADQVDVQSRSLLDPSSPAVQWTMRKGNMRTETKIIDRDKPGTRVILHIEEEFRDQILLTERLEDTLREYGALLPYPVHIGSPTSPQVNLKDPVIYEGSAGLSLNPIPYRLSGDRGTAGIGSWEERYQAFWDALYGPLRSDPPLTIFPVVTENFRGMLFIPSDCAFAEMGRVRLWCRRIFVKHNEEDLLPKWAQPLLSGVLDCKADPNLSRTDLLRSDEKEYKALKTEIESQIVQQLGLLVSYGAQWEK
jgi:HSP90 family molecular chaperone